jgi:hypothetical protein
LKVEPWTETIQQLTKRLQIEPEHEGFDAQKCITYLNEQLNPKHNPLALVRKPEEMGILNCFRTWIKTFPGNIHCEAALASLVVYPEEAISQKYERRAELIQLVNVCDCLFR